MSCKKLMCKHKLNDKSITMKWFKKNHPDKGGTIPKDDFNTILECYKANSFCESSNKTSKTNQANKTNNNNTHPSKVTKKNRAKIFRCMRKIANFSKIANHHKFDKSVFDPQQYNKDINDASPKMLQLLNTLLALDSQDQKNHGQKFKHFIFSDVKDGGAGAKIIASALAANGYTNVISAKKIPSQLAPKLYLNIANSNYNNFALLSSNTIYGTTFNEKIKKELLKTYNERPNNIHGKNIRLIILDSGFKEGIDLFDVKYVHIFEPSLTIADLKQTIGRATRTCGQKGLEFQDNIGWPLYVYNYYLTVPELMSNTLYTSKFMMENYIKNANEKDEDVLLFKDIEKYNDATMNYSEFDKAMNKLSEQLYNLAPVFAVDYELTKNLHAFPDLNSEFMEDKLFLMGGAKSRNQNMQSKFFKIDNIKCLGKCGKKATYDIPVSVSFMKYVYTKYKHPENLLKYNRLGKRTFFCNYLKDSTNNFCSQLNTEWSLRYTKIPSIIEHAKNKKDVKSDLDSLELTFDEDLYNKSEEVSKTNYPILLYSGEKNNAIVSVSPNSIIGSPSNTRSSISPTSSVQSNTGVIQINNPLKKFDFVKMRDYIKNAYAHKDFKWEKMEIKNNCIANPNAQANIISLNPTQKFITHYFTPSSPFKGLLLWHSVGTGKTCTGIATATSSFDSDDYSILWVTRTTLKSDVWKNMFDQVCHLVILDKINKGLIMPDDIAKRKQLLSKNWLEPMSYKQFSNLLAKKNKIYNILLERNGKEDILKKTLIIIDEAHKLYGGDLKASERPNTTIMEQLIRTSYNVSKNESCKLLLMTATPFTNSPLELFSLTNLFMTHDSDKITTHKEEFKQQFMNSHNVLSEKGVKHIANKLSGYISYLNREKDPTQFAQPIMIHVPILMRSVENEDLRDAIYLQSKISTVSKEAEAFIESLKTKIKTMKTDYKQQKQQYKDTKATLSKEEASAFNDALNSLLQNIKDLEEELHTTKSDSQAEKDKIKELKEKIKIVKNSLIQEYILYTNCKHLHYKNNKTQKVNTNTIK
jgi:hypothetical protein